MDLLDRLLGHDAWTTRQILLRCRELDVAALRQPHDVGHGTVAATLGHMVENVRTWTDLMNGAPLDEETAWSELGIAELIARHDAAAADFAALARRIEDEGRLDDRWVDTLADPPSELSYGGTIVHVITHNMHHRAELLHMLGRLGVPDLLEGDALSWEESARATA